MIAGENGNLTSGGPSPTVTPSSSTSNLHPRKSSRTSLACSRCKRRKQRCDGGHPVCGNCGKASAECVYERALRPQYPGGKTTYIKALEERIAFLEARLPEHGEDHLVSSASFDHRDERRPYRDRSRRRASEVSTDSVLITDEEESASLVDGVAYLSLCASGATGTTPEPFYLGSSSGATIARLLQSSIYKRTKPMTNFQSYGARPSSDDALRSMSLSPSTDGEHNMAMDGYGNPPISATISRTHAQILFAVFFNTLQIRWPVLDRELFAQLFEMQWESPAAVPVVHRSIFHLIYAISARFLQLTRQNCAVDYERHFAAALEPMDHILEQHDLATVQFLTLLAIYGSRSPYGAGSWSQIRYAMTLCIELGLHRKQSSTNASPKDLEIRRRVFWACYCLDRMTTMTLGRTFAIADRDINVELPDIGPEHWALTAESPPAEGTLDWTNVAQFAHTVKLRQLQSRVFRIVWRVDKDIATNMSQEERKRFDQKVTHIKALLDDWLSEAPVPAKDDHDQPWMNNPQAGFQDSHDYFSLQYNKTVLSLYSALLPILPPEDQRFLSATQSAAAVCTAYKSLNAQKTLSYTIVALHDCFIAGLTLIYCLWRNPALFDFDALEATRACSLCLTIFGEKWPGAVKYRDIFDATSGSLLKSIVGGKGGRPGSSNSSNSASNIAMEVPRPPQQYTMPSIPEVANEVPMRDDFESNAFDQGQHYGHAVYEAVKSAFTDCDEMGDNGWNGWRSFAEVVQSDMAMAPATMWMNTGDAGSESFSFA